MARQAVPARTRSRSVRGGPLLIRSPSMGLGDWLRLFDAASEVAKLARRVRRPELPPETAAGGSGPLAQMETRLAGVVVAALKEAFDRDRARMDFERAHLDA